MRSLRRVVVAASASCVLVSGSYVYAVGKDDAVAPAKTRLARFWN